MRHLVLGSVFVLSLAGSAVAQQFSTAPCSGSEGNSLGWLSRQERACELRRTVLPLTGGHLTVSGRNGGIEVIGEDRSDIALEARVTAQGSSRGDAEATLREIRIVTAGEIRADGPNTNAFSNRNWSVDFRLRVPRRFAAADLHTTNGSISLANLNAVIHAETRNGGLSLADLAGDVHAETVNGGVQVRLAGNRWQGSGLSAKSTNGGIAVKAPEHYAAHLSAQTVNGGIAVAFPGSEEQGRHDHHLDTDIGGGGPTVHLETVNGGVSVSRL